MVLDRVNVEIRTTQALVVHDVIEYGFDDLIQEFVDEEEGKVAAAIMRYFDRMVSVKIVTWLIRTFCISIIYTITKARYQ